MCKMVQGEILYCDQVWIEAEDMLKADGKWKRHGNSMTEFQPYLDKAQGMLHPDDDEGELPPVFTLTMER